MSNKLREKNKKIISKVLRGEHFTNGQVSEFKKYRESFKKSYGFDFLDEKAFPVMESGFNWNKVKAKLREKFREADASSGFVQVLRGGVQAITNSMYETTETSYEDWVHVVPSSKKTELYTPIVGLAFPREVGSNTNYPEVGAAGLSIQLTNRKFGSMYPIEIELEEDDQTGQFQKMPGYLGEYLKLLTEVYIYGKLMSSSSAMKYQDLTIPASETSPAIPSTEANYPWSQALVGGGKNRPATFTTVTQAGIQAGIIALMGQKNLLGIIMQVSPNRLLIGPNQKFEASILANSSYYPSATGQATAGAVGGPLAINPLQGSYDVTISRYMFNGSTGLVDNTTKAWFLVDDSKPWFVLQMRSGPEVEQEAPNSGESFDHDLLRFKGKIRMNADFIDPRFAWQGNDGSVTS